MDELYQDNANLRGQLDAQDAELVAALRAKAEGEKALGQAIAEKKSLHGEVAFLQQVRIQLTEKLGQETERRKHADALLEETKNRCFELEARLQSSEKERVEVDRKLKAKTKLLEEAHEKNKQLERRAQDAEQSSGEAAKLLQEREHQIRLEADARINEVKLTCAEADLQRQAEMQGALLELQALTAGQQALRSELQSRSTASLPGHAGSPFVPTPVAESPVNEIPLRFRTGQQPWELWEQAALSRTRATEPLGERLPPARSQQPTLLVSDKVRSQVEFLDSQVEKLRGLPR